MAVAVAAVSVVVYVTVRQELRQQVDESLSRLGGVRVPSLGGPAARFFGERPAAFVPLVPDSYAQLVDANGTVLNTFSGRTLPVTTELVEVARGERPSVFYDAEVDGTPVRVYGVALAEGRALAVGRSLSEVNDTPRGLVVALVAISVVGVAVAALTGRLVAAAAVAPVHRLSEAADAVARTGELAHRISTPGRDELGRLAASFNTMLDSLDLSLARQRQLVADASHELGTPLASVRTNIEVLARADDMEASERAQLLADTVSQIGALSHLVEDLVELARGDGEQEPFSVVDLGATARHVVEHARRDHPGVRFDLELDESLVSGAPSRVARAIANLVDNAAKWSPPGGRVLVSVASGTVSVEDEGPGVDPADVPRIFDRFYRAAAARGRPGSGLGLAIVKQVAESHRGSVDLGQAAGGGARFSLRLPPAEAAVLMDLS